MGDVASLAHPLEAMLAAAEEVPDGQPDGLIVWLRGSRVACAYTRNGRIVSDVAVVPRSHARPVAEGMLHWLLNEPGL